MRLTRTEEDVMWLLANVMAKYEATTRTEAAVKFVLEHPDTARETLL